jgi:hypothetical protein
VAGTASAGSAATNAYRTSRSVRKGYPWNAHLPLVRDVIAGTRCKRRGTESGKKQVWLSVDHGGVDVYFVDLKFLRIFLRHRIQVELTNCARRVHCD